MTAFGQKTSLSTGLSNHTPSSKRIRFFPALAAGLYPFLLRAFHSVIGPAASHITALQFMGAAILLTGMFFVPALGMACAAMPGDEVSTRRLAYACVVAPTLYVFLDVLQSLARSPLPDELVWCLIWVGATFCAEFFRRTNRAAKQQLDFTRWRVAHGITGTLLLVFVLFHVTNHLAGLLGPQAHAAVMNVGRHFYRAPMIEPLLVLALFFQVGSGLYLAWRWSALPVDFYRLMQLASGFYLSVFVLGHMNSVFIYARTHLHIPTDWAFATGAPGGLIHDAWNIRLLPHYTLGVFFALTHLVSGLRVVLIAHGASQVAANRLWLSGAIASTVIAVAIVAGMCGVRV